MSEDTSITVKADNQADASITVKAEGAVMLQNEMPRAEYMYGCSATAIGMLLGYYDLYGYMGVDASHLIEGTISVNSRGSDGNIYNMNEFDSVLGNFIANKDYVQRFYENDDPVEELNTSYIFDGDKITGLNTANYTCLADWLGTGQYGRGGEDLSTLFYATTLETILNSSQTYTITVDKDTKYTVPIKYVDGLAGLSFYVDSIGYKLDTQATGTFNTDNNGGDFTFEDYMAEIDAGRVVLVGIEGHSMVGYGYDAATKEIIFDDTYNHDQRMTWGGSYNYSGADRKLLDISVIVFDKDSLGGDPEPDPPGPDPDPEPDPLPTDNPLGPRADVNGDGKTDLVFVNDDGKTWVWWNGESPLGEALESNPDNKFVGTGDFDGNGQDDLLWNEGDGKLVVWYGGEKGDRATLGDADFTKHRIVSTADFDNNKTNDILWQCEGGIVGLWTDGDSGRWQYIGTAGNDSWNIVKAGDFDGSGKNDILWTDGIGNYGLWLDGTNEWRDLARAGSLAWEVATVGRFTAGDRDDILWYNQSTSEIGVWTTNAEGAQVWRSIGSAGSTDWTVVGAGNFGGTGLDDIIWANPTTGEVGVWVDADPGKWKSYGVAGQDYSCVIGVA